MKYTLDIDEELAQRVKRLAVEQGLTAMGINVRTVGLVKPTANYGELLKPNDQTKLFTGEENMIAIALNEEMFSRFNEETQNVLIENLLSQVSYDDEKEKILVNKPEISFNIAMFHKYKGVIAEKMELVYLTQQQIIEEEKAKKQGKKKKRE